jgi:hypothetical protein
MTEQPWDKNINKDRSLALLIERRKQAAHRTEELNRSLNTAVSDFKATYNAEALAEIVKVAAEYMLVCREYDDADNRIQALQTTLS